MLSVDARQEKAVKRLLNIHSVIACSRVNGPGSRLVVFFQGCKRRCQGCFNPETHPIKRANLYTPEEIFQKYLKEGTEGITVSGGEPFLQPEGLLALLKEARKQGLSTVVYTGYRYEELLSLKETPLIFEHLDVLVDGEFRMEEKEESLLARGSKNQRLFFLSSRYSLEDFYMDGKVELIINPDGTVVTTGFEAI